MTVRVDQTIAGWALLLSGTYDVTAVTLAIDLLDDTWSPIDVNDIAMTAYDNSAETHDVQTIPITSQVWAYDADTRQYQLTQTDVGPLAFTPGGTISFKYGLLYDVDNAHVPLALYTWPDVQTVGGISHDLDIPGLILTRLYGATDPTPLQSAMDTLILTDVDSGHWRVTAFSGALGSLATTEVDLRQSWLTSPDTTLWLLVVDNTGVVTATSTGVLADGDRVFDADQPCILPDSTPGTLHVLTVDDSGVLTVT